MRAVLTYHSVDDSGSPVSVDHRVFEDHVTWLASGAVRVLSLKALLHASDDEDAVSVTFDDALESFGTVAAPLLLEAGLPVTVFVVSDYVGRLSDWAGTNSRVPAFPILRWIDLRELARDGVELGAHSRTHPFLPRLSDEDLVEEMEGSARVIEAETGIRPRSFSYPYGAHDDRVVAAAGSYELCVTTELRALSRGMDQHRMPRLDMHYFRERGRLETWGSPAFLRYLRLRRMGRMARSWLGATKSRAR
jgi:peptidoglycan/xylan/chitin deacetylase (PgdA/CDA1 family)